MELELCLVLSVVGPRLLSEPKPQTVDTGMDAAFTCAWTGNPPLTLAWTKEGSSVVILPSRISLCLFHPNAEKAVHRSSFKRRNNVRLFDD